MHKIVEIEMKTNNENKNWNNIEKTHENENKTIVNIIEQI